MLPFHSDTRRESTGCQGLVGWYIYEGGFRFCASHGVGPVCAMFSRFSIFLTLGPPSFKELILGHTLSSTLEADMDFDFKMKEKPIQTIAPLMVTEAVF